MSDWVNHHALIWAWHCDKVNSTAEWVTLVSYAKHCDAKGYSGVSVRHIASISHLHHGTVSQARDRLISARLLHKTKKRRGQTRQTKVYRLPKIAWESGLKSDALKTKKRRQSVGKASGKRSPNRHEELITDKEKQRISEKEKFVLLSYQHQNDQSQLAQNHIKWPEFTAWCRSKGGTPTQNGFWSWLAKQKPQWRNRLRPKPGGEQGYELNGNFFTPEEANHHAAHNPHLITKFRKAVRRHGKIQIAS
jgi:hypothetical protein